jgi:hypothetical protein
MKFFVPLSLFAVAVSAQTTASKSGCDADFILTRCLETETPKVRASLINPALRPLNTNIIRSTGPGMQPNRLRVPLRRL